MGNAKSGRKPKQSWEPCVSCGDKDGPVTGNGKTPARIKLHKFGFSGLGCSRCYNRLAQAERRKREKAIVEEALAELASNT